MISSHGTASRFNSLTCPDSTSISWIDRHFLLALWPIPRTEATQRERQERGSLTASDEPDIHSIRRVPNRNISDFIVNRCSSLFLHSLHKVGLYGLRQGGKWWTRADVGRGKDLCYTIFGQGCPNCNMGYQALETPASIPRSVAHSLSTTRARVHHEVPWVLSNLSAAPILDGDLSGRFQGWGGRRGLGRRGRRRKMGDWGGYQIEWRQHSAGRMFDMSGLGEVGSGRGCWLWIVVPCRWGRGGRMLSAIHMHDT